MRNVDIAFDIDNPPDLAIDIDCCCHLVPEILILTLEKINIFSVQNIAIDFGDFSIALEKTLCQYRARIINIARFFHI